MAMDDEVQKAIRIGQSNKDVIDLAHNWCAHIEVERWGGSGLVELETGLPIGRRFFKCKFARASGIAGMILKDVAVDFYDRNCVGCKERVPIRLPNLSQLVAERDEVRDRERNAQSKAAEKSAGELEARAARRRELSKGSNPSRADIFAALEAFDRDVSEQNRQILMQLAAAVGRQFDSSIQEALFDLAAAGGFSRTDVALQILELIGADSNRVCELALQACARQECHASAGDLVTKYLTEMHRSSVPAALFSLCCLTTPVRGFPGPSSPGNPAPLLKAYSLFPDLVSAATRDLLGCADKFVRIVACHAIESILQVDSGFGPHVIEDLLRSLSLPDDPYGEYGAADANVAGTLAEIMIAHPGAVDTPIQERMKNASERVGSALLNVYEDVLHPDVNGVGEDSKTGARELAYKRFVQLLSSNPENEQLIKAINFLRTSAARFPLLLEQHAEMLLGIAAIIGADVDVTQSPILDLGAQPNPLKQLEASTRRQLLHSTMQAILAPLGVLASKKTESIGQMLTRSFEALGDKHEYFKSALTKALGAMAATQPGLAIALPYLYQAMTTPSSLVRAAAAEAYGNLSRRETEELPSLLHESFVLLLTDPYTIVHTAAVDALRKVRLPASFTDRIRYALTLLIKAYSRNHSNDEFLAECIERLMALRERAGETASEARFRDAIVAQLENMEESTAARFLAHNPQQFSGAKNLARLLLKLLSSAVISDYSVEQLVEELAELSSDEVIDNAEDFRIAAKVRESEGTHVVNRFIEILTAAGAWNAAIDVARDATQRLSDTAWDKPRKLLSTARQIATELEGAAAASEVEKVLELTNRWKMVQGEIEKDNEENRKRRDPLFGLRLTNPGE